MVDQLLQLVDNLPTWTRVRLFGKFSRRARRASLRRVLNLSDGGTDTVLVRRKALVSVLRSIAEGTHSDNKTGIAIWDIERDARRESDKNTTPGSEDSNSEDKMTREALKAESERWFKKESEALARTLEQKVNAANVERIKLQFRNEQKKENWDEEEQKEEEEEEVAPPRAIEKVGVQTIEDEEKELKALKETKEERDAATLARAAEEARRKANEDREAELETGKRMKQESEAAEQARLRLITYELNQRALLESRLELDRMYRALKTEIKVKEEASQAKIRMITNERNQRTLLEFRLELESKDRKLEIEEKTKQKAAEQVKQHLITNERNQRLLLESRLELEKEHHKLKAEKRNIVDQEVKDKAGALEQEAKDREAFEAELEPKKRQILKTNLKTDTSIEDIERGQATAAKLESNEEPLRSKYEVYRDPSMLPSHNEDVIAQIDAKDDVIAQNIDVTNARQQPKSEEERKAMVEKYENMELGLRAYTILDDLGMLESSKS